MAHKIEELPIFQDAAKFCAAVSDTLKQSRLRKNSNAYSQIEDANDSVLANMDEGFAQESDDGFSRYLYYSKGSVAEVIRRLHRAAQKGLVDSSDVTRLETLAETLGRQFGGFIRYLKRSGFKDRGRFRPGPRPDARG